MSEGKPIRRKRFAGLAVAAALSSSLVVPASAAGDNTLTEAWAQTSGTTGDVRYYDGAAAANGSVVLAGWGQTDLGGGIPETDGLVRKVSASGQQEWQATIGPDGTADFINGVAVDTPGNVYVAGQTRGTISGTRTGTDFDPFVASYTSSGALRWTDQFGLVTDDVANAVAVGPDGSVYVAGTSNGIAAGGGGGSFDAFVRKYATNGSVLWTAEFGGADADVVTDVAVADDGTVYVVGSAAGALFITKVSAFGGDLGTDTVAGVILGGVARHPGGGVVVGGVDFLRRYDSTGAILWTERPTSPIIGDVDVESDGSIVAIGSLNVGTAPGILAGFSATGTSEWTRDLDRSSLPVVVATSDGGVLASATIFGASTMLTRFTGSSVGGGGGGGGGTSFSDVAASAFYAAAVEWLKTEGITTGTSPTTFSPDDPVTRGQMAAFLHRLAGQPGGSPAHGFADIPSGTFYDTAVDWLKAEGITTGTSPTSYSPDSAVTRGQMAAFLWRLAGEPANNPPHGFSDVPQGAFYEEAVQWLKDQAITTGTSASTYSPNDVVTRGQMAAFLFRMATDSSWNYPGAG